MKKEDFIRHQFKGLTSEVYDWECLTPTVFLKKSVKGNVAEKEMIMVYLRAAEFLYSGLVVDNNPIYHMKVFRTNQICMPFLYVCRHSLEFLMKLTMMVANFDTVKIKAKKYIKKSPLLLKQTRYCN